MEFLIELFVELFGQIIVELLVDVVCRHWGADKRAGRFFIYTATGLCLGFLSFLVFPHHLIHLVSARCASLVVTPIAVGVLMRALGRLREKKDDDAYGLEAFWPAWGFAFAFGLVRVLFAS